MPEASAPTSVPLIVDLDGTLVQGDLLHEALVRLVKTSPLRLLSLLPWLLRGKAHFKHQVSQHVDLECAGLSINQRLLDYLEQEKARGRRLVLATGASERFARRVADALGVFDEVMASTEHLNLTGETKLAALRRRFGAGGFDYAGNAAVDLPIWRAARSAIIVNAPRKVADRAQRVARVVQVFPPLAATAGTYLQTLRVHQWLKNLLIFIPLIAALRFTEGEMLLQLLVGFLAFSLCASSAYVLNDIIDLEHDRRHPRKRQRPFAAGRLPVSRGLLMIPGLLVAAAALASLLPWEFSAVLAIYFATTLTYTFKVKQVEVLDVLVLALLYTLRIAAGGAASGIPLSVWLLTFSVFLFLSLALAKRCTELVVVRERRQSQAYGRAYGVADLPLLTSLGVGAGYVAVLVLALYLTSDHVSRAYSDAALLWALCPMLIYWITRVWLKTCRGAMHDDPVVFAARDASSRVLVLLGSLVIWLAI